MPTTTGTRTDTVVIPIIVGEVAMAAAEPVTTEAIPAPWLRPPVTSVHRTPRAALAHRWRLFRASRFSADLRRGWDEVLKVAGVAGPLLVFLALLEVSR